MTDNPLRIGSFIFGALSRSSGMSKLSHQVGRTDPFECIHCHLELDGTFRNGLCVEAFNSCHARTPGAPENPATEIRPAFDGSPLESERL